jgi:Domain of unknown function (DUF5134)
MHGPPLVSWLLVALSTATAVSCLLRGAARDEALTGAGMAVMAVPLSVFDPGPWVPPLLAAVFVAAALHSVVRRRTHRLHHTVCSASMAYMALAMSGSAAGHGAHAGHHSAGSPALTGVLLLYFAGYVLLSGTRVAGATPHGSLTPAGPAHGSGVHGHAAGPRLRQSPEVAVACRVSMALGMVAMLLLM